MNIKKELLREIYKTFEKVGAPVFILSAIGGIGDTQTDDEVIDLLKSFNSGHDVVYLIQSDEHILKEAEQKVKRTPEPNGDVGNREEGGDENNN